MNLFKISSISVLLLCISNYTNAQVSATFTGITNGQSFCATELPVALTAANPTGKFSGTGVSNIGTNLGTGQFNPQVAGPGNHTVNYSIGKNFIKVAAGRRTSFAIADDGSLWSWGYPNDNALGYTNYLNAAQNVPRRVQTSNNWTEISSQNEHTMALQNDSTLWTWGLNSQGELGNGMTYSGVNKIGTSKWISISAGYFFSLAVKSDGTLWAAGNNTYGQLGLGNNTPVTVFTQVGTDTDWKSVAAGDNFSCAVKTNGTLWSCGDNQYGNLGNGTLTSSNLFTQVGVATNWKSVSSGRGASVALKTNGTLWSWGFNTFGSLGIGTLVHSAVPVQVGTDVWLKVTIKELSVIGLKPNGSIWSWGFNVAGELGNASATRSVPVRIGLDTDWIDVAMGDRHSHALKSNGNIWSCGQAHFGILGNGTNPSQDQMLLIETITHDEAAITVTVLDVPTATNTHVACNSYTWRDGVTYNSSNSTATFIVPNAATNGCDSIYYLALTVLPTITKNQAISRCESYTINGNTYTSSQIIKDTLFGQASNGCDSIVITDLLIKYNTNSTFTHSVCKKFTWVNGVTYTSSNNTAQYILPNSVGCDSIITLDLTILNVGDLTITRSGANLISAVSGAQYQWYDCSENQISIIPFETEQTFSPLWDGSYFVVITANGCVDTTACYPYTIAGTADLSANKFILFPNPSIDGKFNFSTDFEIISMTFCDLTGRKVNFDVDLVNKIIHGDNLPQGTYFVYVTTANGVIVREFVL